MARRKARARARREAGKPGRGISPYTVALLAIVAYALFYSAAFIEGPSYYGDDTTYLNLAHSILQGNYVENSYIFSVRLLNILPTALFYWLFGTNIVTDSLWDIISFIGIIIVSYLLGKELYSELAGIIAALLAAFFPLIVQLSSTVSDDIPMAFFTAFAMLALLYGVRRSSKAWYFAAGVLLLASFLVTPEGVIIDFVAAIYVLFMLATGKIKLDITFLYLPLGFIALLMPLMAFNYLASGNPLITFTVNLNFYSAVGKLDTIPSTDTNPMFYPNAIFPYQVLWLLYYNLTAHSFNPIAIWQSIYVVNYNNVGFYFYALIVAMAYLLIRRERKAYFAIFYFAACFLYLEFGPMHVSLFPFSYLLSYRLARFLTIIGVPTVLVIGIALARAVERGSVLKRRMAIGIAALSVVFLIATAIPINLTWYEITHYETYDQMAIADYLNGLGNSTVVYFPYSHPNIPMYMHYDNPGRLIAYQTFPNCSAATNNSYIIIPANPQFGINYTKVVSQCPDWEQVYIPPFPGNYPGYVTGGTGFSMANLYYVP